MSYIISMIHDIYGIDIDKLSCLGIYAIYHEAKPQRLYIGSTTQITADRPSHRGFYKRFYDHTRELKQGKHHSKYLQNTVNKYGLDGLKFKILQICNKESQADIRSLEQEYLDKYTGGGNLVDGPALKWLSKQPPKRIWVSDMYVFGLHNHNSENLLKDCIEICKRSGITRLANIDEVKKFALSLNQLV